MPVAEGSKKPALVNVRNRVTKEIWDQESDEVKNLVVMKVEAHHQKAKADYAILRKAPKKKKTAEEYHM